MRNYDALYQEVLDSNLSIEEFKLVVYRLISHNKGLCRKVQNLARSSSQQRKLVFVLENSLSHAMTELREQSERVRNVTTALELARNSLEQTILYVNESLDILRLYDMEKILDDGHLRSLSESVRKMSSIRRPEGSSILSLGSKRRRTRINTTFEEDNQPSCSYAENAYISGRGRKRVCAGSSANCKRSKRSVSRFESQDELSDEEIIPQKHKLKPGRPRGRPSKNKTFQNVSETNKKSESSLRLKRTNQSDNINAFQTGAYVLDNMNSMLRNFQEDSSADESQNEEPILRRRSYRKGQRNTEDEESCNEEFIPIRKARKSRRRNTEDEDESQNEELVPRRMYRRRQRNTDDDDDSQNEESAFDKLVSRKDQDRIGLAKSSYKNCASKNMVWNKQDESSKSDDYAYEMPYTELDFSKNIVIVLHDVLKNSDLRKYTEKTNITNVTSEGHVCNGVDFSDHQLSNALGDDIVSKNINGFEEPEHLNKENSSDSFPKPGSCSIQESSAAENNCNSFDHDKANHKSLDLENGEFCDETEEFESCDQNKSENSQKAENGERETYSEVEFTVSEEDSLDKSDGGKDVDFEKPGSSFSASAGSKGPQTPPPLPEYCYTNKGPRTPPGFPPDSDEPVGSSLFSS